MKKQLTQLIKSIIISGICFLTLPDISAQTLNCVDPALINPNIFCITLYSPVCGCDGITYSNACEAQNYAGVTHYTAGPCLPGCDASFTFSPDAAGLGYQFHSNQSNSTGTLNALSWDFGDGHTSNLPNPHHVYNAAGSYVVCLTVTGSIGSAQCTATECDTIIVSGSGSCIDLTLIDPSIACPAVIDPVCGCDGIEYTNSCIARHRHGVSTFTLGSCNGNPCQALFNFSHTSNNQGVQFHNQSVPASAFLFTSAWDFGDGTTSALNNPLHVYSTAGTYYVCLTITYQVSPTGFTCTDTYCDSIKVGPATLPCQANFTYSYGIVPPTVFFTDNSIGPVHSWRWDFGDGTTSSLPNPTHIFPSAGAYMVCLTITRATTPLGPICIDTYCDTVLAPGCVDSNLNRSYGCLSSDL